MQLKIIRTLLSIVLLCGVVSLTACSKVQATQEIAVVPTSAEDIFPTAKPYPSNTEDVVHQFLISYPVDPESAILYLSPAFVQRLDAESALNLLPEQGEVSGFMILEGYSDPGAEIGVVKTSVACNGKPYEVIFNLVIHEGLWKIDEIVISNL